MTGARGGRGLFRLDRYIPEGEVVILRLRPSLLFIPLSIAGSLATILVIAAGAWWGLGALDEPLWGRRAMQVGLIAALVHLGWQHLEWLATMYVLTDRRAIVISGVLQQTMVDVPLRTITNMSIYRSIRERIFGLGTLGFDTAGGPFTEIGWRMLRRPHTLMDRVREVMKGPRRIPVIGLAGGIGSGKSHVAREFARRGCLVVDSDAEARAALDRPEVRAVLVGWWGAGVVGADGKVDRKRVGAIVFGDPEERRRLEALVHPLVRESRARMVARARGTGAVGVIVDAPLLFEAGVDKECDAVVFVDAPTAVRLERVRAARGWDEAELSRREAAQWPAELKRAKCRFVIANEGGEIGTDVDRILAALGEEVGSRGVEKAGGGG